MPVVWERIEHSCITNPNITYITNVKSQVEFHSWFPQYDESLYFWSNKKLDKSILHVRSLKKGMSQSQDKGIS